MRFVNNFDIKHLEPNVFTTLYEIMARMNNYSYDFLCDVNTQHSRSLVVMRMQLHVHVSDSVIV